MSGDGIASDLLRTLLGLGPGGVVAGFLFYLWKDERSERRDLQAKVMGLLVESTEAEKDMTKALESLSGKIK